MRGYRPFYCLLRTAHPFPYQTQELGNHPGYVALFKNTRVIKIGIVRAIHKVPADDWPVTAVSLRAVPVTEPPF